MWQTGNICKGEMLILTAKSLQALSVLWKQLLADPHPTLRPGSDSLHPGRGAAGMPQGSGSQPQWRTGIAQGDSQRLQLEGCLRRAFPDWHGCGCARESARVTLKSSQVREPLGWSR